MYYGPLFCNSAVPWPWEKLSLLNYKAKYFPSHPWTFSWKGVDSDPSTFGFYGNNKIHKALAGLSWMEMSRLKLLHYLQSKLGWDEAKKKKKKEDVLVSIKSLTHYCPSWTWNRLSWHHWRSRCRWHWWRGQKCSQSWRSRGWQGLLDDETCKRSKF